jgi:hypothetical protein
VIQGDQQDVEKEGVGEVAAQIENRMGCQEERKEETKARKE